MMVLPLKMNCDRRLFENIADVHSISSDEYDNVLPRCMTKK